MSAPACPSCDAPIEPGARACPNCRATFAAEPKSAANKPPRWLWIVLGLIVGCPTITVVIGVVVTVFAPQVLEHARVAAEAQARADLEQIERALDDWAAHHDGRYPAKLDLLVEPDEHGWRALELPRVPKDPWKHAYTYASPGPGETRPRVGSFGLDGAAGGGDDLGDVVVDETR
ncbi:MAG: type II secretion system protein GspG [Planctomycetota bacterium]